MTDIIGSIAESPHEISELPYSNGAKTLLDIGFRLLEYVFDETSILEGVGPKSIRPNDLEPEEPGRWVMKQTPRPPDPA